MIWQPSWMIIFSFFSILPVILDGSDENPGLVVPAHLRLPLTPHPIPPLLSLPPFPPPPPLGATPFRSPRTPACAGGAAVGRLRLLTAALHGRARPGLTVGSESGMMPPVRRVDALAPGDARCGG